MGLAAQPPSMASRTSAGSTPEPSAIASASATAPIVATTMSWLQAFATAPAPTAPQCTTRDPSVSSTGPARWNAAGSPPAIIDKVPSAAACGPPETGTSRYAIPAAAIAAPAAMASAGDSVDVSTTVSPSRAAATTPAGPSRTVRTAAASGRLRTMTSAASATWAAVSTVRDPVASAAARAVGDLVVAMTSQPARRSVAVMALPITPRPTTPTVAPGVAGSRPLIADRTARHRGRPRRARRATSTR